MQKRDWLSIAAFGYLVLPLQIFILTHLKNWLGIPVFLLISYVLVKVVRYYFNHETSLTLSKRELILGLLLIVIWVFLSGIGGYAFQNSDHDTRNAILRDLINYKWPVVYQQNNLEYELVYYTGFWLPSALIGKWLGWKAANISLFLWSTIGVFLTVLFIKKKLSTSIFFCIALLVLFSGMDILGVATIRLFGFKGYPFLWPPISHLEWWAGFYQYSSNTTQLFWVFNQAIPCWIIMGLIINKINPKYLFFLGGITFYYAPLPAIGLFPYILLAYRVKEIDKVDRNTSSNLIKVITYFKDQFSGLKTTISFENVIGGCAILILSILYYGTNSETSRFSLIDINGTNLIIWLIFVFLEFGALWIFLSQTNKLDLGFYVTGAMLLIFPFISMGQGWNFAMRSSIPLLFVLMIYTGIALTRRPAFKLRMWVIAILIIGTITPIYEINRSIYRTYQYYSEVRQSPSQVIGQDYSNSLVEYPLVFEQAEVVHPESLISDEYKTLTYFDLSTLDTIVAPLNKTGAFFTISNTNKYLDQSSTNKD